MLATLPFPVHRDFGRAGIHGRRTSQICNLNLISKLAWQFVQEHRACSVITAQNKREINGSRNWFGRKQVVSPTLSGIIGLLNWLAIASVLYCRQKGWIGICHIRTSYWVMH